ncbi:MAG: hypothetical protein QF371_02350 [Flavobacteriales bacterium]|jgi:predicted esterase|nr:hypothetical protein [Flavobacteriales bacterium]
MLQIKKALVEVPRTCRYFSINSVRSKTKNIWIVLHGYGQLAEYFIRHFSELDPNENHIIAPEGISRFYVNGLSGRVGASWMTKEDRENEVHDQSYLINAVLNDCNIDPRKSNCRIIVLGFSQGATTAVRWLVNNKIRPDQLILWAGSFPHDVKPEEHAEVFDDLPVHFAYGDEDPILAQVNLQEKLDEFKSMGVSMKQWAFKGKHTIDKDMLQQIVDSFDV